MSRVAETALPQVCADAGATPECCPHHHRLHLADRLRGAAERVRDAVARRDERAQIEANLELDALALELFPWKRERAA